MIEAFGITDAGRVRRTNEDAFLVCPDVGLFAVADGMGGHLAGEVASRVAIESLDEFVRRSLRDDEMTWPYGLDVNLSMAANRLRSAFLVANRRVVEEAASRPDRTGMGATLTAVLIDGNRMVYGHIGDSRLYVMSRGDALRQLTRDDSWVATLAEAGRLEPAEIARHPMRHVLTNVLGARQEVAMQLIESDLQDGDLLVACSDGLSGPVDDAQLQTLLSAGGDLEAMARSLVQAALDGGGRDNVTAVLIRYSEPWPPGANRVAS